MSETKSTPAAVDLEARLARLEAENATLKAKLADNVGTPLAELVPGPAKYRLTKQSFIGGVLLEAGAVVVKEGPHRPGRSWVRIDAPVEAEKAPAPKPPVAPPSAPKQAGKPGRAVDAEV